MLFLIFQLDLIWFDESNEHDFPFFFKKKSK